MWLLSEAKHTVFIGYTGGLREDITVGSQIYSYSETGTGSWTQVSTLITPRAGHAVSKVVFDEELQRDCVPRNGATTSTSSAILMIMFILIILHCNQ